MIAEFGRVARCWFAVWAMVAAGSLAAAAESVQFARKPSATADGQTFKISFEVSAATDVEVAILGADGKVVRHLAAGVLGGENRPPAPLKAGLAQELVWDGQDDFGKPAAGGPFKARVRAGMGAKFGRFIGQDPYYFGWIKGMVVGDDGNLYISAGSEGYVGPDDSGPNTVRVFSPEGKFIKTLLPFPADLPPGAMKDVARWDEAAKAWLPRNLSDGSPEFYGSGYQLVSASRKGGVILAGPATRTVNIGMGFVPNGYACRLDLQGGVPGTSLSTGIPCWPAELERDAWGPARYCVSPDEKYLYLSGPVPSDKTPNRTVGSVWRIRLDGSDTRMSTFVVIPSTPDGPWTKRGANEYNGLVRGSADGICCDRAGNVYVCDHEKDRVAIFDEGGNEIGEISVKDPESVAIHPKTGAIYVLRRRRGEGGYITVLDKFNTFEKGATAAATFANFHPRNFPKMAVTASGDRTLVWLANTTFADHPKFDDLGVTMVGRQPRPVGLLTLEDKGTSLQPVSTPYDPPAEGQHSFDRITTDPMREEVYVSNNSFEAIGINCKEYRYNGDTGEGGVLKKDGKIFYANEVAVGYDGLLYVKIGPRINSPLGRLTHDLAPAPFPATGTHILSSGTFGRCGQKGLSVGPDGTLYHLMIWAEPIYSVVGWKSDGLPLKGMYLPVNKDEDGLLVLPKNSFPEFFQKDLPPERKTLSCIVGPVYNLNGGIRVDLKGNIYLGMGLMPKGYTYPDGLENDYLYTRSSGSVVKFHREGGAVLGLVNRGSESKDPDAPRLETDKRGVTIEGGLAMYPGLASFMHLNPASCSCMGPRFDVDRYGRLAIPNVFSHSVNVVDNAGNVICEFGKYGNFDSQYMPPDTKDGKPLVGRPDIPLGWPVGAGFTEKAIYVSDFYNFRVVRVDKTWKVEETCGIK